MWSEVSFTTPPSKMAPPSIGSKTQTTINLSWRPHGSIADAAKFLHYEIQLESSSMDIHTRTTTDTTMLVGGLEAAETYTIRIRTITTQGSSPFSDAAQAVTDDYTISKLEQWRESLGVNALRVSQS